MDSAGRSIAKAVSWQALGLISSTLIAYGFTGSLAESGALAFTSMGVASVVYVLHERIWNAVGWGRNGHGRADGTRRGDGATAGTGYQDG